VFGKSGNRCAYPDCIHSLIEDATQLSEAAVTGNICHIYAVSDNGPRGKPGLTTKQRNDPENLILMCRHHHTIVDEQHEEYPAQKLKEWKAKHESQYNQGTAEAIQLQGEMQHLAYLTNISDQQINGELARIIQARHLSGFSLDVEVANLAHRVENAELKGGSAISRARAMAWCARLRWKNDLNHARQLLEKSRKLAITEEADIAEAFLMSTTDRKGAMSKLAAINSQAARSAMLRIVAINNDATQTIEWVNTAGLTIDSFDADGKLSLLMSQVAANRWDELINSTTKVTQSDLIDAPVLEHMLALTQLIQIIPDQLRSMVVHQIPFEATTFPLFSDTRFAIEARQKAIAHFAKIAAFAESVNMHDASNRALDYSLWLRLRDPHQHKEALGELRSSMREERHSLRRVHLALQFGVKLDLDAIELKLNQQRALSGGNNLDETLARFSLAFAKDSPREIAAYIAEHRDELYEHLNKEVVVAAEIDMLSRTGLIEVASQRLEEEVRGGLSTRMQDHLLLIIEKSAGADPTAKYRNLYEESGHIIDLMKLVDVLDENQLWDQLKPYSEILFQQTRSVEDAKRVAKALDLTKRYSELLKFLQSIDQLVEQSTTLKSIYAWALFNEGKFDQSEKVLDDLRSIRDHAGDRALQVDVAIASGQWHKLTKHISDEWENRNERTAEELIKAASLAQTFNIPHAKDLIVAATIKDPSNPENLANAYFLAIKCGWEDAETARWISTASALSTEDGPIKSFSMRELLEQKPAWDRQATSAWEQLNSGTIPIFGAAHMLRRSLTEFILLPAIANLNEKALRKRGVIYTYSGARAVPLSTPKAIAIDLTALFTIASLGILDRLTSSYIIYIPHSTLSWLFSDRQRVTFHQPSRIQHAHLIKRLMAQGVFKILENKLSIDHPLAAEIGVVLANGLVAAEEKTKRGNGGRCYLIRSSPIHRLGSLLEEEADITPYSEYVCSCHAVIERLRNDGLLTEAEEQRALAYLNLYDRKWSSEPSICDNAEIILDDVSLGYLRAAGVLEKFRQAQLTVYITDDIKAEADQLIEFEAYSAQQLEVIEQIRQALVNGMQNGQIHAVRANAIHDNLNELREHTTFATLNLNVDVDALVIDDRFVNRYMHMDISGRNTPILTSVDLLNDLLNKKVITDEQMYAFQTRLRQSGHQLIPLATEEILYHLRRAAIKDSKIMETAELKAIRESLLKARMVNLLQIPLETPWLQQTMRSLVDCVKQMWNVEQDIEKAKVYSEWLIALIDIRGWAPSAILGNERNFVNAAYAAHVQALMPPPINASNEVKNIYQNWIDDRLVKPLRDTQPEAFDLIVKDACEIAARHANDAESLFEGDESQKDAVRKAVAITALKQWTQSIRDVVIKDETFAAKFNLAEATIISIDSKVAAFDSVKLFQGVKSAFTKKRGATSIESTDGERWKIEIQNADERIVILRKGKKTFPTSLALTAPDARIRLEVFRKRAEEVNLPIGARERWEAIIEEREPRHEIIKIQTDLNSTPVIVQDLIRSHLNTGNIRLEVLVPNSLQYYERLVGKCSDEKTIAEYIDTVALPLMRANIKWKSFDGYQLALLLAAQPGMALALSKIDAGDELYIDVFQWVTAIGDPIARVACIEIGLSILATRPAIKEALQTLIQHFTANDAVGNVDQIELISSLFYLTYGELSSRQTFADRPPFWRRLAAIAHASLIARELIATRFDLTDLIPWFATVRTQEFYSQCLIDLREEPRWYAEWATPIQLTNELMGRVWIAANINKETVVAHGWTDMLLGEDSGALTQKFQISQSYLPGPLEGNWFNPNEIPDELSQAIKSGLSNSTETVKAVFDLAYATITYQPSMQLADLLAQNIIKHDYDLLGDGNDGHVSGIYIAMAMIAANSRSHVLADAIITTLRKNRRANGGIFSIFSTFRIVVIVSASRKSFDDWARCLGTNLTELAFQLTEKSEAQFLRREIVSLCELVPNLWATCGQAEAALQSIC